MEPQVKKDHYFRKKYDDLNRFISYFYQVDLLTSLEAKTVLEIGKGNGFFSDYAKKLGYSVTTCDFDKNLNPDYVGDIRSLPFQDNSFDVVTAFEVLEHVAFEDVSKALAELKRVSSKFILISLPYKSTGLECVIKFPGLRTLFKRSFLDFFIRIPLRFGGIKISGQHYWEIDAKRYSLSKVRRILKKYFQIRQEVKPALNKYHYFFVLQK